MDKIKFWIIIGLVAVIVFLILTRPSNTDYTLQKKAYETEIAILKVEKQELGAQFKAIVEKAGIRSQKDSLVISAKNEQIRQAKAKVVIRRVYIEKLADSIPELKSFVQAQDSLIEVMQQTIDTLKVSRAFHIQVTEDLIANHNAEESIEARIDQEKDARISSLEKQNRNTRRGNRWLKVGVIVLPVAALLFGTSL